VTGGWATAHCRLAWLAVAVIPAATPAQPSLPRAPGAHIVTMPGLGRFSEPSIAVNPRDPSQVVAVWQNQVHAAWSADSGRTFTAATGVQPPNYEVSGDVSVTFDDKGRAYLSYMGFDRAAPRSTLDRKLARQGLFVRRSDDGGRTWAAEPSTLIEFPTGNEPDIQAEDMPRIFADVSPGSPHAGNLYVGWIEWQPDQSVMLFSRSTDGAHSWSRPVRISTHAGWPRDDNGALVGLVGTVGPDGTLWMAWNDGNTIALVESRDGGRTFRPSRSVIDVGPPYFHNGVPGVSRVMGFPQIGIGPRGGRLYLCWSDYRFGDVDVFVSSSDDLGRTWSAPVRVNDERLRSGTDQFFQWMAVDPANGDVYVQFYDRRDDPTNTRTTFTLARSTDHGTHFTNYAWSDAPFSGEGAFLGDYTWLAAIDGRVYGIWAERPEAQDEGAATSGFGGAARRANNQTVIRIGTADFRKMR
jgi:hypothetical protein